MTTMNYKWKLERQSPNHKRSVLGTKFNTWTGAPSDTVYGGLAGLFPDCGNERVLVTIAVRDTMYLQDFCEHEFSQEVAKHDSEEVINYILSQMQSYSETHLEKLMGVAMPYSFAEKFPSLCPRLWADLDIAPFVLHDGRNEKAMRTLPDTSHKWEPRNLDEESESMGRKCVRMFGPDNIPLLQVGYLGIVEVDSDFHVKIAEWDDYERTVGKGTVNATLKYASEIKKRGIKIAAFSATPQGGGVALMRHSLVRCCHTLGVDMKWYVPKPRPGVFNATKTTHNILQGVSKPGQRLTEEDHSLITKMVQENARRYWLHPGGPLCKPSEGGADFIIVDDPQMPSLIQIAKQVAPERPVVFRSHIQMRSDLIATPGSPQEEAWGWLWQLIKKADMFICHPVGSFVPINVPYETVGFMPATTDWLDGLNKHMRNWDLSFYGRIFNTWCRSMDMPTIEYPEDDYIVQVARFDPSKGIPDVLESYEKFHKRLMAAYPDARPPKLLLCGHGSVDDPEGTMVYDSAVAHIEHDIPHIRQYVCVMRVRPSDQILNALVSKAKIGLQLSTREGFEVKISELLHKGKPVIATRAGGIPLQIEHGKNGFLVDVGDTDSVAQHLLELFMDRELYDRMSDYAATHISDEVSTVGNTLNWLYLASKMTKGEEVKPNGRFIHDLASDDVGSICQKVKLKRETDVEKM